MYIIKIYNNSQELKQQASFSSNEEATEWLANQEAKTHTWRIKEGFYHQKFPNTEPDYEVEEESDYGSELTKYFYKQNYSVETIETYDNLLADLRNLRNKKLIEVDFLINKAFDADNAEELALLKARRQALRDLTETYKNDTSALLNKDLNKLIEEI